MKKYSRLHLSFDTKVFRVPSKPILKQQHFYIKSHKVRIPIFDINLLL